MSGRRRAAVREAGRERDRTVASRWTYLESSALVAALVEHDDKVIAAIDPTATLLSALTLAESRRAVQRALHARRLSAREAESVFAFLDTLARRCPVIAVSDEILARAGRRFPVEPLRTLDAIHLATAELLDTPAAPITLLTLDQRIRENAVAMGLRVI